LKTYQCYSAGPGLFPRTLPSGQRETWEEAQTRVQKLNAIISAYPCFDVITPSSAGLEDWPTAARPRVCMLTDLFYATRCDIVFADVTPFGGREPDSGTVVEAVSCALSGGLLVLWANPLTTFAERYQDAEVHPDSEMDLHYNLMLEQLFYISWEMHFGFSHPVFADLEAAVNCTGEQIQAHGLRRSNLLQALERRSSMEISNAIKALPFGP